jgi:hypothetical protein
LPNKPIETQWQRLDHSRTHCTYCLAPLKLGETSFTCDRCWKWRMNEGDPHELEEYSRPINTRPPTPEELELEETARLVNELRRSTL